MSSTIRDRNFEMELLFNTSRSGGPGGQNVNKVNTKVEIRFNILESSLLNEEEKERLIEKLSGKINKYGELIISSQESRSQNQNREYALEKFYSTLEQALHKPKKRKPSKPSKAAKEKRLEEKKKHSEKKARRQDPLNE